MLAEPRFRRLLAMAHSGETPSLSSSSPLSSSRSRPSSPPSPHGGDAPSLPIARDAGTLMLYERILRTAGVSHPRRHLVRLRGGDSGDGGSRGAGDALTPPGALLPTSVGRASGAVYGSILRSRSYDPYGRSVPFDEDDDEDGGGGRRGARAVVSGDPPTHGDLIDVRAEAAEDAVSAGGGARIISRGGKAKMTVSTRLTTPAWKIGTKPVAYGPPALAPPIQGVLNSEGNEKFFSCELPCAVC